MVFFAIAVIYTVSPLIQVKSISGKMLLALMVVLGILANPNTVSLKMGALVAAHQPVHQRRHGLLHPVRLAGQGNWHDEYTKTRAHTGLCGTVRHRRLCYLSRNLIRAPLAREFRRHRYLYCGPAVFICAVSLLTLVKNTLSARTIPVLGLISRHSLGIYGFHALIIHALRTNSIELKNWPPLDMLWIFSATLAGSLLLSVLLQRIDTRRLVS